MNRALLTNPNEKIMSATLKILGKHEIRAVLAENVPPQYRVMAVAYFHTLLELLAKERLLVVQADNVTYRRLTAMADDRLDVTLAMELQDVGTPTDRNPTAP